MGLKCLKLIAPSNPNKKTKDNPKTVHLFTHPSYMVNSFFLSGYIVSDSPPLASSVFLSLWSPLSCWMIMMVLSLSLLLFSLSICNFCSLASHLFFIWFNFELLTNKCYEHSHFNSLFYLKKSNRSYILEIIPT